MAWRNITVTTLIMISATLILTACSDGLMPNGALPPDWGETGPVDNDPVQDMGRGGLDERCDVGFTCDEGLVCKSGICKEQQKEADPVEDPAADNPIDENQDGGEGSITFPDQSREKFMTCSGHDECVEGLKCIAGICQDPEAVRMRREGESCSGHGDCSAGLKCISGLCMDPEEMSIY